LNASGKLRRLIVSSDIVTSRPFSLSEVSTKAGQAHCTGEPFYEMVKAEMPEKLLRSFTGTRFVFDSEGHT
jgi:hypothetical protein